MSEVCPFQRTLRWRIGTVLSYYSGSLRITLTNTAEIIVTEAKLCASNVKDNFGDVAVLRSRAQSSTGSTAYVLLYYR